MKGLVYTTFAVLATSLLLFMTFLPTSNPATVGASDGIRIGETAFFLESVMSDMERSLSMASRRAFTASTDYVIVNNQPLVKPDKNLSNALVNASISGQDLESMENVSLQAWTDKVRFIANNAGYSMNTTLVEYNFSAEGLTLKSSFTVYARLSDPVSLASFNRTREANTTISVSDVEDTMLLLQSAGRYSSKYGKCSFNDPAEQLYTGSYGSGSAHGSAVVNPAVSNVNNPGQKILVVDDVDSYNQADVNNFKAVVSAGSNSSTGYTSAYAFDTGSISGIETNETLIVSDGEVWFSGFETMFSEQCYVDSARGPDVLDRLSNRMVSPNGDGLATIVDVSELPPAIQYDHSSVGYAYFNDSYGAVHQIEGISDEYSWFRLDDYHVNYWGLNDLVK